jgi:hypothetical protein
MPLSMSGRDSMLGRLWAMGMTAGGVAGISGGVGSRRLKSMNDVRIVHVGVGNGDGEATRFTWSDLWGSGDQT